MTQTHYSEGGFMLLEVLLSSSLLLITALGLINFIQRSLLTERTYRRILELQCITPTCVANSHSVQCTCGVKSSLIIR